MDALKIANHRLSSQQIAIHRLGKASQVVAWLAAIQAQDISGAIWSVGLRLPSASEADVEQAIVDRTTIRTWLMRGTLHLVATEDIRWIRALLAPGIISRSARRQRELGLDAAVLARCKNLFVKALAGGMQLPREELFSLLENGHISTAGQRGYHILRHLALEGILCFGVREDKQETFVLLDEWSPPVSKRWSKEESLAELTKRYFTGRGPATLQDFAYWSGLPTADVKTGLSLVAGLLQQETITGKTYFMSPSITSECKPLLTAYLLPGFDEYVLGYKDRSAFLDQEYAEKIVSNGMFAPTIVINGRVVGTWKRTLKKDTVVVSLIPFTSFSPAERNAIAAGAKLFSKFVGRGTTVFE